MGAEVSAGDREIGLEPAQFAAAFPFHIAVDGSLCVLQAGASLRRICPDVLPQAALGALFRVLTPQVQIEYGTLLAASGQFVLLEHLASGLKMRGEFIRHGTPTALIFLGSPWITDPAEIASRGLRFQDFAPHDPVMDHLQVLQSSQRSVAEGKQLARLLQDQSTQLRAALEQLREQEAEARKLALIAARTDNAVVLTDPEGHIEWVNAAFTHITGYELGEVLGRSPGEFLQGPGTDATVVGRIRERLRRGEGFREKILNYRKDGGAYWIAIEAQPILGDDGHITHYMAIERDISAEVLTQIYQQLQLDISGLLLQASTLDAGIEAVIRLIGSTLGLALGQVWIVSNDALTLSFAWESPAWNMAGFSQASHALRFARGEGLPGRVWQTMRPESIPDLAQATNYPRAQAAGRAGLHNAFAFPVLVDGALWGVCEFFGTSTDGELRDSALLQMCAVLGNQLGQFVARRKLEEDLRIAKEKAEALNELKSRFVATLSHEIRTPLNALIGMGSLLEQLPMDGPQRHYLDTIRQSSDQLLTIVNDVLDMSHLESGRIQARYDDFELESLLEQALRIARGLPGAATLRVVAEVGSDVPRHLRGDAPRLTQVLINLVSNAVKFTERGSVTLRVATIASGEDARIWLSFSVTDTGRGISPADQQRIFEPFEQGQSGRNGLQKGSGLGLSISRGIAQLLGGSLEVQSTEGNGSTFTLRLPLGLAAEPAPVPVPRAGPRQVRLRVLVAEDTPTSQMVIRLMLERLGHSVRVVNDGAQAVSAFFEEPFDLVLMDVQMPHMDGYAATQAIVARAGSARPLPPIIGLSALSQEADRARARSHGMSHYLVKPIKLDDLSRLLAQIAQEAEAPAPSTAEIDRQMLEELCENLSAEGFRRAMAHFEADARSTLTQLRKAAEDAREEDVRKAAHRLKGLFSQFGAETSAAVFAHVETLPAHERSAFVKRRVNDSDEAIDAVRAVAAELLGGLPT
jgi:PAS domain S-box-containing protein